MYTNQRPWYSISILYLEWCIQTRGRGIVSVSCTWGGVYKLEAVVEYLYLVRGMVHTNQRPWYSICILYLGWCIQTRGRGILSVSCTWGGVYKPEAVVEYLYLVPGVVYTNQRPWYSI